MFNAITEIFLNEYYMYENVALSLISGGTQELFCALYDAFLLPCDKRDELYALTERDEVKSVRTKSDFLRLQRVRAYSELMGEECDVIGDELEALIAVKGNALKTVAELKLTPSAGQTPFTAYKRLYDCANGGSLAAMRMLGFLQCVGTNTVSDAKTGADNLMKAAQWNCIEGMLLSLYFDESRREENVCRLYTVARGTPYEQLVSLAQKAYCVKSVKVSEDNELLKKAFGACVLKPEAYSPQHARFIFSKVLGIRDKEQLLFADSREAVAETADLPLKLSDKFFATDEVDRSGFDACRAAELEKVIRRAVNGDMRKERSYRPLCICSESRYLRKRYSDIVAAVYSGARIEYIDVAALTEYDFEPTKNNIFVRNCDEDNANVYLLYFVGEIKPTVLDRVKTFLLSEGRKRFRLSRPCVDIDLSPILPVCISDKANAKDIKSLCDVVNLAPVAQDEKRGILERMISRMHARYKGLQIRVEEAAMALLIELSVDIAKSRLEKIIRFNRTRRREIVITPDMINDDSGDKNNVAYGFGGRNEI